MDPRIFRQSEINQFEPKAMGKIFHEKNVGMDLADFFRRRTDDEMFISPGVVIVGGRKSIEEVCRKHSNFKFRGQNNLAAFFMRTPSGAASVARTVGALASAPARGVANAIDRNRQEVASGLASNLGTYLKWEAKDLAKIYASSEHLRMLASAMTTRYTCVTIQDTNEDGAAAIFAGHIATGIERGMAD